MHWQVAAWHEKAEAQLIDESFKIHYLNLLLTFLRKEYVIHLFKEGNSQYQDNDLFSHLALALYPNLYEKVYM